VSRSREAVWLALAGGFIAVGGVLLGVAYSRWTSAPMVAAYVLFGLAVGCIAAALADVPIPFPSRARTAAPPAPAPARLEVVRPAGGRLEGQDPVQWLTRFQLSRELWGRPDGDAFDFLRRRSGVAGRLAAGNEPVREHLAAAQRQVPDYVRDPSGGGGAAPDAVGILAVTVTLLVKVRNVGAEAGGVTLLSSAGRVLRPPGLQSLDARVEYTVTSDEARHLVAPGTPADVPVTVRLACARDQVSRMPVDSGHAVAVARTARAFARFLSGPIEGIEVDAVLDGGQPLAAALEVRITDAAQLGAVSELDVDALEHHLRALDDAVDQQTQRELGPRPAEPEGGR
jgi:hypothetical protein